MNAKQGFRASGTMHLIRAMAIGAAVSLAVIAAACMMCAFLLLWQVLAGGHAWSLYRLHLLHRCGRGSISESAIGGTSPSAGLPGKRCDAASGIGCDPKRAAIRIGAVLAKPPGCGDQRRCMCADLCGKGKIIPLCNLLFYRK